MATVPVGGLLRQVVVAAASTATITVAAGQRAVLQKVLVGKTTGTVTHVVVSSPALGGTDFIQAKAVSNEFIQDAEQIVPFVGGTGDDIVITLLGTAPIGDFFIQYTLF